MTRSAVNEYPDRGQLIVEPRNERNYRWSCAPGRCRLIADRTAHYRTGDRILEYTETVVLNEIFRDGPIWRSVYGNLNGRTRTELQASVLARETKPAP